MKINKKLLTIIVTLLATVGFLAVDHNTTHAQSIYSAKYWGASRKVTIPQKLRGSWYFVNDANELTKIKFTTHMFNKATIYKFLSEKEESKYFNKYNKLSIHKQRSILDYFTNYALSGIVFTWHNKTGINLHAWLIGEGGGAQYVPVTRNINGKKVKAIRIGGGAYNSLNGYAYKTKSLAIKRRK